MKNQDFDRIQQEILTRLRNDKVFKTDSSFDSIINAKLFARYIKPYLLYNADDMCYMYYEDGTWLYDRAGVVASRLAMVYSSALYCYSGELRDGILSGEITKALSVSGRKGLLTDVKAFISRRNNEFDLDSNLLNTPEYIINLITGEKIEHSPEILCKRCTGAHYNENYKRENRFTQFILEIMSGDADKARFLQAALGYSLYGHNLEEKSFFFGTQVRSGKSTLMNAVGAALGNYAMASDPSTFETKSFRNGGSGPEADIVRMRGARLLSIPETKREMLLDCDRVKRFSGEDPIVARGVHQVDTIEFMPSFTMFFNCNTMPKITDLDLFVSERIIAVPFNECFDSQNDAKDITLKEQFVKDPEIQTEILMWLLEGVQIYNEEGLQMPEAVIRATEDYRRRADTVTTFFEDMMEPSEDNSRAGDVYEVYAAHCEALGLAPETKPSFFNWFRERGLLREKGPVPGFENRQKNIILKHQLKDQKVPSLDIVRDVRLCM